MEKQYVYTERTHFMCPRMHFGIAFEMAAVYEPEKVQTVFERLAAAHPFLNCMMAQEENGALYYDDKGDSTISVVVRDRECSVWEDYANVGNQPWDVFHNGLLKVFLYPENESGFQILFVAHHLLCDGRALLQLVTEFADCYAENKMPAYAQERLITSAADLPEKSGLSGISKMLVKRANRQWRKENHAVSYAEYTTFEEQFAKSNPCGYIRRNMPEKSLAVIRQFCHENGVTVNDYLLAVLFQAADTGKIVIGVDAREDIACYQRGAIGNYSSAVGITCKANHEEITRRVKKIHRRIEACKKDKKKWLLVLSCYLDMDAGLVDAAAIASLGHFNSEAAKFVGGAMFGFTAGNGVSMTNLGSITNKNIQSAVFFPPLSPSAKEVVGVLTTNGQLEVVVGFYKEKVSEEDILRQLRSLIPN